MHERSNGDYLYILCEWTDEKEEEEKIWEWNWTYETHLDIFILHKKEI